MLGDMLTQLDAKPVDQSDPYATMPFNNIKTACSVSKRTPSRAYKRPCLVPPTHTPDMVRDAHSVRFDRQRT
jgi:hypothetical protein